VEEHGFTFIGQSPDHIRLMGDKIAAKAAVIKAGIPVVPGSEGAIRDVDHALEIGLEIGFPVIVKATAGGGGRGMKIAQTKNDIADAFNFARAEAQAAFGNGEVYIEKFLTKPRHIEVQILADNYGNVVHLGERDCSLQRRHQKLLEEAPSPALNDSQRAEIGEIVAKAISKIGYRNVGTIEFLYEDGKFYFIEMNTRLQVEHPVTEAICGIDLVREMLRVASGAPLGFTQEDVKFSGHAIECRINAEHPVTFMPSPGTVGDYHAPGGLGVRVDSGLYSGYTVPPHYDSMIAKLIVHGANRNECLMRLRHALSEYFIDGVDTTIPLHQRLLDEPDFVNGDYDIHWLEKFMARASAKT
ncbi:MAG: ATP-grasp domain-containing protein, partial [Rhodospirillales bacterium]|nr:ATP-grasp domain-containing protein [Rhodospirillales bacterium]